MRKWARERIAVPILELLKQGVTPEKIALSIAFGIVLGVLPALGITTALCFLIALIFRLNPIAIQIVNYAMYPLQIALLLPFIRLGEFLFRAGQLPLTIFQLEQMVHQNSIVALHLLWTTIWHAITAWALIAPFAVVTIYLVTAPILRRAARRYRIPVAE